MRRSDMKTKDGNGDMQSGPPSANIARRLASAAVRPLRLYPSAIVVGLLLGTMLLLINLVPRAALEVHVTSLAPRDDRFQAIIPRWDRGWPWVWQREADAEYLAR